MRGEVGVGYRCAANGMEAKQGCIWRARSLSLTALLTLSLSLSLSFIFLSLLSLGALSLSLFCSLHHALLLSLARSIFLIGSFSPSPSHSQSLLSSPHPVLFATHQGCPSRNRGRRQ